MLIFSGCKKSNIQTHILTGQWQWQYSEGGIAGQKIIPENNRILLLNFNQDSTFSVTENGSASFNGIYQITIDTTYGKVIHFNPNNFGDPNGEIYIIQNNQLILTDYMISDGYTHYYKRIK